MHFMAVAIMLAGSIAGAAAQGADERDAWLTPALTYDGNVLSNLHGGARTGSTSPGNLHLRLTARGDSIGWVGTSAYLDVLTIHGGHPSRLVGDAQGVSNIEGPAGTQIEVRNHASWFAMKFSFPRGGLKRDLGECQLPISTRSTRGREREVQL